MKIKDIYDHINSVAPFCLQEGYDNSGLCIGSMGYEVKKILVALDCTIDVAKEAAEKGCELIVTHHPVIFHAIKKLDLESVAGCLAASRTSVISAHTNFDSAVMNDILCERLGLSPSDIIAEENGAGIGCICDTEGFAPHELAERIAAALGNKVVRYNRKNSSADESLLRRIAVCSGSGGSFLNDVLAKGCDAFITGDVKHDVFIDAYNSNIVIYDAGHFHTENIFCEYMKNDLSSHFPEAEVSIAESNFDVLDYFLEVRG